MDSWELLQFIEDIVPSVEVIEGKVFLNRKNLTRDKLLEEIGEYSSISEAQKWINIVPVDDYLSQIIDKWDADDPNTMSILSVYQKSWFNACAVSGAKVENLQVNCLRDDETGDVAFQLSQY